MYLVNSIEGRRLGPESFEWGETVQFNIGVGESGMYDSYIIVDSEDRPIIGQDLVRRVQVMSGDRVDLATGGLFESNWSRRSEEFEETQKVNWLKEGF